MSNVDHVMPADPEPRPVNRRLREPVVFEAYADADLSRPCPNCPAGPGKWCNRPDGRVRRTPCIARITTEPANTEWETTE